MRKVMMVIPQMMTGDNLVGPVTETRAKHWLKANGFKMHRGVWKTTKLNHVQLGGITSTIHSDSGIYLRNITSLNKCRMCDEYGDVPPKKRRKKRKEKKL